MSTHIVTQLRMNGAVLTLPHAFMASTGAILPSSAVYNMYYISCIQYMHYFCSV
jgi:hypothetical protein